MREAVAACSLLIAVAACGASPAQARPLGGAVVGGSQRAWMAKLGHPHSQSSGAKEIEEYGLECSGRPNPPDSFAFQVYFSDDRAVLVSYQPCPLDHAAVRLSDVLPYLPADSKVIGAETHRIPVPIDAGGTDDYTLHSTSLESSLSSGVAAICDGEREKRGTVHVTIDNNGWVAEVCKQI